ncbi:heart- and neural crest derivatives-expressed protein 2-like [Galendromus occidentalis]|uniref:Heart- and neural crest derivatives-expressed protein 2-like n=1 Tax=Galendromus occidentalis TaxID=34638 RepID=A0AAJ7WIT7_9ACAR|nr:heart- and neural crest derivatives-expressed protein 2-like [Galendromus occidentalis]
MTTALPFHASMSAGVNSYGYYNDYSGGTDYWNSASSNYPNSVSSHGDSPDPYSSPTTSSYYSGSVTSANSYAVDGHPYGSSGYAISEIGTEDDRIPRHGPKRRVTANRKERRRTQSINNAFSELRDCIPNVPSDTKLSKIKTLRLATSYIAYLMELLDSENDLDVLTTLPGHGFKAELGKRTRTPEQEERRKRELALAMMHAPGRGNSRSKGRTGWPQHVWALELESPGSHASACPPVSAAASTMMIPPPPPPTHPLGQQQQASIEL